MTDEDAGHVGDGVRRPGRQHADGDAEVAARARAAGGPGGDIRSTVPLCPRPAECPVRSGRMTMVPVVWAPGSDAHRVLSGVWCGVSIEADELPERGHVLLDACRELRALRSTTPPTTDWTRWPPSTTPASSPCWRPRTSGGWPTVTSRTPGRRTPSRTGSPRWPAGGAAIRERPAATIRAELGRYAMDTMTPIGDGTWEGAKAASDAAATAADLVLGRVAAAYAICRPPGHHAGPGFFGGSCYLNNAAVAAARLRRGGVAPRGHGRHRRPPRQRHPGLLLGRPRGVLRVRARRSRRGLVPAHRRLRGRGRCLRDHPQRPRLAGHRGRRAG